MRADEDAAQVLIREAAPIAAELVKHLHDAEPDSASVAVCALMIAAKMVEALAVMGKSGDERLEWAANVDAVRYFVVQHLTVQVELENNEVKVAWHAKT